LPTTRLYFQTTPHRKSRFKRQSGGSGWGHLMPRGRNSSCATPLNDDMTPKKTHSPLVQKKSDILGNRSENRGTIHLADRRDSRTNREDRSSSNQTEKVGEGGALYCKTIQNVNRVNGSSARRSGGRGGPRSAEEIWKSRQSGCSKIVSGSASVHRLGRGRGKKHPEKKRAQSRGGTIWFHSLEVLTLLWGNSISTSYKSETDPRESSKSSDRRHLGF